MASRLEFPPDLHPPTRREATHNYVEHFDERDTTRARHIADSITEPTRPLAHHLVLIPVAAHQEAPQIELAMTQYANQVTQTPFSVVLGLNSPLSEIDNPQIESTLAAVERSKVQHPQLDIRTSMTFYKEPTIGMIRRDLWNGALLAAMDEGAYQHDDDEMIGINHDIDTISINPRYVQRVQDYYNGRRRAHKNAGMRSVPFAPRATLLKHAPSSDHPNISKGAYWMDFLTRQMKSPYEASLVAPLSHYADRGGFQTNAKTYETRPLIEELPIGNPAIYIPGTTMQTSPRRYVERLRHGYDNVWTNETFGSHDNCRTSSEAPDITQGELEEIITRRESIADTIHSLSSIAINQFLSQQEIILDPAADNEARELIMNINEVISRKISLTHNVLTRVVESPSLSTQTLSLYRDVDYRSTIIADYFSIDKD